ATLRLGEDHDLNGALAAVGLGRRADADEGTRLDIGQARLDHPIYRGVVGELHLYVARLPCLDGERRAIHRLDRPAQAHRLRLLRQRRRSRKRRDQGCARQQGSYHSAHGVSSENGCVPFFADGTHKTKPRAAHRTHMGGVMPSRPTETEAASSVPSSFLLAAAMKIFEPGLSSLVSPGT